MQKIILYIILCLGSLRAAAQTTDNSSASTDVGLQHTIAATVTANTDNTTLYGALYDLRLRNLHPKVGLAVGADFGYGSYASNYRSDYGGYSQTYKSDGVKGAARCVALFGRKSVAFETGLLLSYSTFHRLTNTVYDAQYNRPSASDDDYRNRFAIAVPLGVRYQPARAMVFASLSLDLDVWRAGSYSSNTLYNDGSSSSQYKNLSEMPHHF